MTAVPDTSPLCGAGPAMHSPRMHTAMPRFPDTLLFEVSWEVCNKVGGIHTVVRSKAAQAVAEFGDGYCLIGPNLPQNIEFEETDEACWRQIREPLAMKGLECRFGRWQIPARPKVILVRPGNRYNKDQLLFRLWEKFGVDSIAGGWDYIEPVLFSTAAGEVIATVVRASRHQPAPATIAQFHEWMCGAGLLYLKEHAPQIATVFTTHATVLGRSMMGNGRDLYAELDLLNPVQEARNYNVVAKHCMEQVCAREADCFTAVSDITVREAQKLLGRRGSVTENGINLEAIPNLAAERQAPTQMRQGLLEFGRRFLGVDIPESSRLLLISGRYEFTNKGVDVFLDALAQLQARLGESQHVLAYLFVIGGHLEPRPPRGAGGTPNWPPPICTHRLPNENNDPILISCLQNGLTNLPGSRVHVIFSPVYLGPGDNLFNLSYYDVLQGFDLGVFPSKYEPWGYTPLEAAAYAVPTISTDLAGFGIWADRLARNDGRAGVLHLPRLGRERKAVVDDLTAMLQQCMDWDETALLAQRTAARRIAEHASWQDFYVNYLNAYEIALHAAEKRAFRQVAISRGEMGQVVEATSSMQPHFRSFVVETELPAPLARLRDLAGNLWWSWQPAATSLFMRLDPFLWERVHHNPVVLLDQLPPARLAEVAENEAYVRELNDTLAAFDRYLQDETACPFLHATDAITWSRPVAYFSTEFGIHESLPIYSGGLGILSGDHLKSASDLNIPLVGIGLFYSHGYFTQRLDAEGNQVAEYTPNHPSQLPLRQLRDDNGVPILISVDLPGRTLYAAVWKLEVGRITLYLMDTDLPANTAQDRHVTGQLYVGDERVRIEQEILLGIGGARLLSQLGIRPSVCHLNEGHSAFLIFEQIRQSMRTFGLSFDEAKELVRSQVVFTTHTPVEAGNERFSRELMQHYFANYMKELGLSAERILELGRLDAGDSQPFIMTILALKLSSSANGVSRLHGKMSRKMWQRVWAGTPRSMVPISSITNGIHVPSFVAPEMGELLDTYLGADWREDLLSPELWSRIKAIPDQTLWETRCALRQQFIAFVRDRVAASWVPSRENDLGRDDVVSRLRGSSLTIGFARRFAPYKRAHLLFSDLDRLERLVGNPRRPVQFVFAGKAHPKDTQGCDLVRQVVTLCRDKRFAGRIVFLENYDLALAKRLVAGVDVWLNTPRRPYEASGTSGQKVAINGGVNLSVADGWWCEGAQNGNGWTIGPGAEDVDEETVSHDAQDAADLYSLLEDVVVPLFYQRNNRGIPEGWLEYLRGSMMTVVPSFNTERMLIDYFNELYKPCAERGRTVAAGNAKLARAIAEWKRQVAGKFSSLHLLDITTSGLVDGTIQAGRAFQVSVRLDLGDVNLEDLRVELVVGRSDAKQEILDPHIVPMAKSGKPQEHVLTFSAEYTATEKGNFAYGIRILPWHEPYGGTADLGLVIWA